MNSITKLAIACALLVVVGFATTGLSGRAGSHTVTMTGQDAFAPKNAMVRRGESVVWQNRDEHNHTVESDTAVIGLDSDLAFPDGLATGERYTWIVPADAVSGTVYFYHCRFHGSPGDGTDYGSGMVGSITIK